jgi:hypothetical protein
VEEEAPPASPPAAPSCSQLLLAGHDLTVFALYKGEKYSQRQDKKKTMSSVPTLVLKQRRKVEKVINKKKVIIMTTTVKCYFMSKKNFTLARHTSE